MGDENQIDSFNDLFEPFELEEGPPPASDVPEQPPQEPIADSEHEHVSMVSCPSCGTANPSYNRHCEACGARLSTAPLPVAPPPMLRATPGSRALGVLVAVVLIVTLIALFINIFGGDDGATSDATTTVVPSTTLAPVAVEELQASTVEASSELGPQWASENLIDGNLATEWQDRSLSGRGAVLTFRFQQPVAISELEIYNLPDDARFKANYRIRGFRITVDDLSYEITGQLADVNTRQVVQVASISTRTLILEVTSTFESESVDSGVPFTELALADVRFFGRLAN